MSAQPHYAPFERFFLWTLAATGLVAVNGAFLYGLFFDRTALAEAMGNPVSVAFQLEAFLLLAALTWLLPKWGVSRLPRSWFVVLCLLGSLAFALPAALLWSGRTDD
jgi:hypothetical protein